LSTGRLEAPIWLGSVEFEPLGVCREQAVRRARYTLSSAPSTI